MTARRFGQGDRRLMTLRQVAELGFGRPAAWIYHRIALFRTKGFPDPFPGTALYDPKAIDLWMDSLMPKDLQQLLQTAVDDDSEITAARQRLQQRLEERISV